MLYTLTSLWEALKVVMSWDVLSLLLLGTLIGFTFGFLPGLSGNVAVAIMIPLTYKMPFAVAMAFLMSILASCTFPGSITACMINIPGAAVNLMTVVDGHPLAKQGRGFYAISVSAFSSMFGSLFSIVILIVLLPFFNQLFFLFAAPERFLFIILGLIMVAFSTKGYAMSGLLGMALGILASMIGFSVTAGGLRYTGGISFLWDGIASTPFFVGCFAIAEFIDVACKVKRGKKRGELNALDTIGTSTEPAPKAMREALTDLIKNKFLMIRCSIIGFIVGFLPGIGGSAAQTITYAHAIQSAKDKSRFGHGDVRGVIGPESSNNAKDIGQILPTFGLGIPGSVEMAVILGALMLHGIQPGTNLFTTQMDTVWIVIVILALGNILSCLFGLSVGAKLISWMKMPPVIYMSVILAFALLGAFVTKFSVHDITVAMIFGVIGYMMKINGINRVTFVVAYILGEMLELYFWQVTTIAAAKSDYGIIFFNSPATVAIWAMLLVSVFVYFLPELKAFFQKMKAGSR